MNKFMLAAIFVAAATTANAKCVGLVIMEECHGVESDSFSADFGSGKIRNGRLYDRHGGGLVGKIRNERIYDPYGGGLIGKIRNGRIYDPYGGGLIGTIGN